MGEEITEGMNDKISSLKPRNSSQLYVSYSHKEESDGTESQYILP